MDKDIIQSLINQRRRQMLIHSYIYYRLAASVVSDKIFDKWAFELVDLQDKYPDIAAECVYQENLKDWDGTTGFQLSRDSWVERKAHRLLEYHREQEGDKNK